MKRALAILFLFFSIPAAAVYVNGAGTGQALIYPYYTTQSTDGNAFNTYVTIVNGHAQPKALRVRIREGRAGREIAGFNLFLQGRAMWAAVIVPYTDGGAFLVTPDTACTDPAFILDTGLRYLSFLTDSFSGTASDGLGTGRDRLREGYIEVVEMASFPSPMPACDALIAGNTGTVAAPQGRLYGMLTLINVANGMDFTENAVALDDLATAPFFRPAADPYPSLAAAEIGRVASFVRNEKLYRVTLPSGLQAVEAAMVAGTLSNELVLDKATASATDWVITMPTRFYHDTVITSPWLNAAREFDGTFRLEGMVTPRNGATVAMTSGCGFTCPGGFTTVNIQANWAASVLGFFPKGGFQPAAGAGTTAALGSRNGWIVPVPMDPGGGSLEMTYRAKSSFAIGYPAVTLTASTTRLSDGAVATENIQLTGLPVVGFMARTFSNGTLDCGGAKCQGNYGGTAAHRIRRIVDPTSDRPQLMQ